MTLSYQPPGNGHSKLRAYIEVQLPWPLPNIAIVARGGIFDCLMKKQQQQHNANGSGSASGAGIVVAFGSEKGNQSIKSCHACIHPCIFSPLINFAEANCRLHLAVPSWNRMG